MTKFFTLFLSVLLSLSFSAVSANEIDLLQSEVSWVKKYGEPDAFFIMYDTGLLAGHYAKLGRRLETWFYFLEGYKITFDNGHRVSIKTIPKIRPGSAHASPLHYFYSTTRTEVETAHGKPVMQRQVDVGSGGKHQYVVDSYMFAGVPFKFTFLDGQLVGAVGGLPLPTYTH